jgi:hypothetical protein
MVTRRRSPPPGTKLGRAPAFLLRLFSPSRLLGLLLWSLVRLRADGRELGKEEMKWLWTLLVGVGEAEVLLTEGESKRWL